MVAEADVWSHCLAGMDPYAGMKRTSDGYNADVKRQKTGASKVLHVRGLPYYTTEAELAAIVAPFGQVARTLILHDKNQAFVQMTDVQAASDVIAGLEYNQPTIRSKAVYFQFSSRQEVEVRNNQQNGANGAYICLTNHFCMSLQCMFAYLSNR